MSFGKPYEVECNNGDPMTVSERWMRAKCVGQPFCLRHLLGKLWLWATEDSFQVDVKLIDNPAGAGAYMSKYLDKDFYGDNLLDAGFRMRYNFSRSWPKLERLHLRGTDEMAWVKVETISRKDITLNRRAYLEWKVEDTAGHELLEVVGEDYALRLAQRARRRRRVALAERMFNAGNDTKRNPADNGN